MHRHARIFVQYYANTDAPVTRGAINDWMVMAEGFPLSDTVSFQTKAGWYDLIVTTAYIPASLSDNGEPGFRTVADLHAPHTPDGTATLLQNLMRDYRTAPEARAGHAEVLRLVEERQVPLPIPDHVTTERKLRA